MAEIVNKIGMFMTFKTTDSTRSAYNGQVCEIIRVLSSDEADLEETGPMYRVAFGPQETSVTFDAFEDELESLK